MSLGTTRDGIELRCEGKPMHIHGTGLHLPASGNTAVFLACARIGVIHSVVLTGFSAESLRDGVARAHHQRRGLARGMQAVVDSARLEYRARTSSPFPSLPLSSYIPRLLRGPPHPHRGQYAPQASAGAIGQSLRPVKPHAKVNLSDAPTPCCPRSRTFSPKANFTGARSVSLMVFTKGADCRAL
ncbi:hypothetical protein K438DRAFT_1960406 [Mycena galopus ATCC 62051]|nr:hypothetical protein K438DRAFT_1960406 [Mycena galopus ATCC 62051]